MGLLARHALKKATRSVSALEILRRCARPKTRRSARDLGRRGHCACGPVSAPSLEMWDEHAQLADGSVSVDPGLMLMLDYMQSGRFKVFCRLNDWFEEFRLHHRKNGQVVKERDDLGERDRRQLA